MAISVGPVIYTTSQERPADQHSWHEGKILIVDHDSSLRRTLHVSLYGVGFDIGEAARREDAIALCRIVPYDAVLLDVEVLGKSEIETCNEFRRFLPAIAILIMSVNHDQGQKIEALETVADDYVVKPFEVRELTARIRAILRARSLLGNAEETITIGEISLHTARHLVLKAGEHFGAHEK